MDNQPIINTEQRLNITTEKQKKLTTISIIIILIVILATSIYFATKENKKETDIEETNSDSQEVSETEITEEIEETTETVTNEPKKELPAEEYINESDFPETAMFSLSGYDITIHFPEDHIIENQLNFDSPAYHLSIMLEDEKGNDEPIEKPIIIIGTTDYFADWALVLEEKDYETINVSGKEYEVIQYGNGEGYGSMGWYEKTAVAKIDEDLYVMIFNYSSYASPSCNEEYGCTEEDYSYTMSEEQLKTALKILKQAIFEKK